MFMMFYNTLQSGTYHIIYHYNMAAMQPSETPRAEVRRSFNTTTVRDESQVTPAGPT